MTIPQVFPTRICDAVWNCEKKEALLAAYEERGKAASV